MTKPQAPLQLTPDGDQGANKRLTRRAFWIIFAISFTVFLVVDNPLFGDPFDIDGSILWSYSLVPILVAVFLVKDRRWNLAGFFVGSLEVGALKFVGTYLIAATLWGIRQRSQEPDPTTEVSARPSWKPSDRALAPPKQVVDAAQASRIKGRVVDAAGRRLAGATVWVARGLEAYSFAPPSTIVTLRHHDHHYQTNSVVIRAGQPVIVRTDTDGAHTAVARGLSGTNVVFNRPVVKDGKQLRLTIDDAIGWITVRCTMHEAVEQPLELLVIDHPFFARSDAQGAFVINGVPAGELQLRARLPGRRDASITVTTPLEVRLTLEIDGPTSAVSPNPLPSATP